MKKLLFVFAVICFLVLPQNVYAYSVTLKDFEGRPAEAKLEVIGEGTNEITFELELVNTIADFRGFFFDFSGELSNFHIEGEHVTKWDNSGDVTKVGGGVSMEGTGASFDVGIELGSQGIGKDDIRSTAFTVYNDSDLTLGDFFGVRLTSVGENRQESRKLLGGPTNPSDPSVTTPVPEPGTMLLVGAGLVALIGFRKKLRSRFLCRP
jgi:hypothetical protein